MKEKFIKSTIVLLIGGLFTKILGMVIKIVMSRLIGTEGLGLYMLILPTFSLFIGISQLGMPVALAKLIAEDTKDNRKLFFSVVPVILLGNIFLIFLIIILAPVLANNLFHNSETYYGILAISLVIPFTSISSICRSYFFGKERMVPHVVSNLVEDVVRLLLMIVGIPFVIDKGLNIAVCYIILSNIISETASIIVLFLFLPKKLVIKRGDLKPDKSYVSECLSIGIPNTTGRLIGSIGYFLEPIILSLVLLSVGYNNTFITREYGILSGYVMPLILLPSFFTLAISQALLPVVSKEFARGKTKSVRKKIRMAIFFSLVIGVPATIFFVLKPEFFLRIVYHTNEGVNYMKFLAPVCLLQYIQAPLATSLDAMGKSRDAMIGTTIGMVIRTSLLFVLSYLKIGLFGLIIAISINVVAVTLYDLLRVRFHLKKAC